MYVQISHLKVTILMIGDHPWMTYDKKKIPFLIIGRFQDRCGDAFFFCDLFFCQPVIYTIHGYAVIGNQTKFSIHKVWWLREASLIGQTFIRIPIDPAILAAIGHRIIKKEKDMRTRGPEVTCVETRIRRLFGWIIKLCSSCHIPLQYELNTPIQIWAQSPPTLSNTKTA